MKKLKAPVLFVIVAATLAACAPNGLSPPTDRPSLKDSQKVGTPERFSRLNPGRSKN